MGTGKPVAAQLPGFPYVIIGVNQYVAGAATNNPIDLTDACQEQVVERNGRLFTRWRDELEPLRYLPQVFRVRPSIRPAGATLRAVEPFLLDP